MDITFRVFPTGQDARTYRHDSGCGGWIFVDDKSGEAIIFPPHMTPTSILTHPMTRGKSGALIGSA